MHGWVHWGSFPAHIQHALRQRPEARHLLLGEVAAGCSIADVAAVENTVAVEERRDSVVANTTAAGAVVDGTAPGWQEVVLLLGQDWRSSLLQDLLQAAEKLQHLFEMSETCDWVRIGSKCSLLGFEGTVVKTDVVEVEVVVVVVQVGHREFAVGDSPSAEVAVAADSRMPLEAAHRTMTYELVLEMGRVPAMWMGIQHIQIVAHSCPFVVHYRCSSFPCLLRGLN